VSWREGSTQKLKKVEMQVQTARHSIDGMKCIEKNIDAFECCGRD
jgi:hypothetical protein